MDAFITEIYDIARYYIHWFTDRDNINLILETNDELQQRFNYSLTYKQCMELYDILETIKTPRMIAKRDLVGRLTIVVLEEDKSAVIFALE
jgi:hypothetical protein